MQFWGVCLPLAGCKKLLRGTGITDLHLGLTDDAMVVELHQGVPLGKMGAAVRALVQGAVVLNAIWLPSPDRAADHKGCQQHGCLKFVAHPGADSVSPEAGTQYFFGVLLRFFIPSRDLPAGHSLA
jgi:hypothetical protein